MFTFSACAIRECVVRVFFSGAVSLQNVPGGSDDNRHFLEMLMFGRGRFQFPETRGLKQEVGRSTND